MIFRSHKRRDEAPRSDTPRNAAALDEVDDVPAETVDEVAPSTEDTDATAGEIDVDELDGQDWRDLGPYDISEVDAEALEQDRSVPRIDLGSMVLSPMNGSELRLQVDENSQQVVSAMMIMDDSALEVGAFAAPRSGGLWAEIREDLVANAEKAGGSANLVEGPFGVELRRLLPVKTPDGQQGYQPSRMWVAEGPRWMLRGIIYGQAALEDGLETPVAEMLEAFRQVVVRRGDDAMAPGDLLPLSVPESMTRKSPSNEDSEPDPEESRSTGE